MTCKFMKIKLTKVLFYLRKDLLILMMRTFIFLFCTTLFSLTPKHICSQNTKIVIDVDQKVSVDEVFDIIKAQTDYIFIYHEDLFIAAPKVQLKKGVIRLNTLLNQSLSAGDLNVIFKKNNTILINEKTSNTKPQQRRVTGTVTDQSGLPIPGATVLIKGTIRGAVTNLDGQYRITVPNQKNILVFSSLGFEPQDITVGTQTIINVSLNESISALDEVTINAGYYNTTQKETTGSISKIDAKTIEKQPANNPLAAMQGYLSGVNITQDSGDPGGGFNIEIRGKNFLRGGTDPLYIVDGVPFASESLLNGHISSSIVPGSPLNLINPSSIESIEVLKDADATAIYGSRGANGVVLITTKKGKTGKTQIKINITSGVSSLARFVDLLNTEQYIEMRKEAYTNDGIALDNLPSHGFDLSEWDQDRYTDWQKVLIGGTAYRNTAQLSLSGGNEQTQFLLSGSYQNETTVYIGDSNYGKTSVHSRINHQSMNKNLQVSFTMDYTADDNQLLATGLTENAYSLPPNAPALYDENGDLNWEGWNNDFKNPAAQLERKVRAQSNNLLLNSVISYQLLPNLVLKANLGYTDYDGEAYRTSPHTQFNPAFGNTSATSSSLFISNALAQSWIVEPQLNWQKDWGKASLDLLMGSTFQQRQSKEQSFVGFGFVSNSQILNLKAANRIGVFSFSEAEYKYQSVFGRLNFKWADKYIMNLTGRRDGSSRFGPAKQFGDFGAVGAAWIFSEEIFLKESPILSFGKLRSSYGVTGSDNIGDYKFYDAYSISHHSTNYDGSGLEFKGLFNPNYAWEENKKFEVALELGFFQDRLFLTTAWYQNRSSNQLISTSLPYTTGFDSINSNFDATVENTGLEVDFRAINIQNKDFKWTTTFNISVPKNKLLKFDGLEASAFRHELVVGQPLSIKKLFHTTGVDPESGLHQFEDYNGDGVIELGQTSLDRGWVEHTAPKFYGGLGNTLNYKNWSLDAFFQFKKHRAIGFLQQIVSAPGTSGNRLVSVLNRWQQVGDVAPEQRYTAGTDLAAFSAYYSLYDQSNAIYTDASFIRLRNVSLTYSFPKTESGAMDASIYLQGSNILTLTKYKGPDPDQADQAAFLPLLKQFTLGLQLGF